MHYSSTIAGIDSDVLLHFNSAATSPASLHPLEPSSLAFEDSTAISSTSTNGKRAKMFSKGKAKKLKSSSMSSESNATDTTNPDHDPIIQEQLEKHLIG